MASVRISSRDNEQLKVNFGPVQTWQQQLQRRMFTEHYWTDISETGHWYSDEWQHDLCWVRGPCEDVLRVKISKKDFHDGWLRHPPTSQCPSSTSIPPSPTAPRNQPQSLHEWDASLHSPRSHEVSSFKCIFLLGHGKLWVVQWWTWNWLNQSLIVPPAYATVVMLFLSKAI